MPAGTGSMPKRSTMKQHKLILAAVLAAALFTACVRDEPVDNRIYPEVNSALFTISNWDFHDPSYVGTIDYGTITYDILHYGAIMVYLKTGENSYSQLPVTFYQDPAYSTTLEVVTALGVVHIYWTDSDLAEPIPPPTLDFKVVTISESSMKYHPEVDWSDYNEVQEAFNLEP